MLESSLTTAVPQAVVHVVRRMANAHQSFCWQHWFELCVPVFVWPSEDVWELKEGASLSVL